MEYNAKNPAIKRIMREVKDMEKNPSLHYTAKPREENLFDWHFTVQGPPETDFEGGRYHGRIILPPEYPFKPPSIILLTPNGRFQLHTKICLSITGYHPEYWQPAWSVATVLTALVSFFPAPAEGALGSLDTPSDTRRHLAKKSLNYCCPDCGEKLKDIKFAIENEEGPKLSEADKEFISLVAFKPEEAPKSESSTSSDIKKQETTPVSAPEPEVSSVTPESKPSSNPQPTTSTSSVSTTPLPSQHSTTTIDVLILIALFSIVYLMYLK